MSQDPQVPNVSSRRPLRTIPVGIGAMAVSNDPDSVIVTHDLGSCIAVAVYDPVARIGGLLHYLLPLSRERAPNSRFRDEMYADTGVPLLFERMYALGAAKGRMKVKVAGGAVISKAAQAAQATTVPIGTRNYTILRKMFWQNQVLIAAEDVGGTVARSVSLDVGTGVVNVTTVAGTRTL